MTFHGRSNPGKNKYSIGYRHKQGNTFQVKSGKEEKTSKEREAWAKVEAKTEERERGWSGTKAREKA